QDRDLLADLYARSLRSFQHDARLEELTLEYERLEDEFEARRRRSPRDREAWRIGRELGRVERELALTRRQATYEARSLVDGLGEGLERFGYLPVNRPGRNAPPPLNIFDTNALTQAELPANRGFEG